MSKIVIVVTHLLGTGHLARALVLGRGFHNEGHAVVVISGGMPVSHLDTSGIVFEQLPPLKSDGIEFTRLLNDEGALADDTYLAGRKTALLDALTRHRPDVVVTELFPFGRRVLNDEFTGLLHAAAKRRPRPLICCSIRDILAPPSKPAKADRTHALVQKYYDIVLVHSDETITALDASWPVAPEIAPMLRYTGFVAEVPAGAHPASLGAGEILVSAGGGSVGMALFETALMAARADPARRWRLLVGGSDTAARCTQLRALAPSTAVVEPARREFRQMLHHAAASVSMCGYNTALDILQSGIPAVFVPFDAGGEVEQTLRARALAEQDGIALIPAETLEAEILLRRLDDVTRAPKRATDAVAMQGASSTVGHVMQALQKRRA